MADFYSSHYFYEDGEWLSDNKYHYHLGGYRCGRTHAIIVFLKKFPKSGILLRSLDAMDYFISQGVKPSQIMWPGEFPTPNVDIMPIYDQIIKYRENMHNGGNQ